LDDGTGTPSAINDFNFIGATGKISPSNSDQVGAGRKLVFNPTTETLFGISKDANQIYIIDTKNDAFTIKVFRADVSFDEVITYLNDGLTLAINRATGVIFYIR
jgi:hypothetical protein